MNRLQRTVAYVMAQAPAPVTRERMLERRYHANAIDALVSKGYLARDRAGIYHPTEAGARFVSDNEAASNG